MDLSELAKTVGKYAPLLGKLLPIPGAGIAGDLIASALGVQNTPESLHKAIQSNPDAYLILAKLEEEHKAELQKQLLEAETTRIKTVNQTMQVEAGSEHWIQWFWRPYNGVLFGTSLFLVYALPSILNSIMPIFYPPVAHEVMEHGIKTYTLVSSWLPIKTMTIPEVALMAWGGILGIAAWHRGKGRPANVR